MTTRSFPDLVIWLELAEAYCAYLFLCISPLLGLLNKTGVFLQGHNSVQNLHVVHSVSEIPMAMLIPTTTHTNCEWDHAHEDHQSHEGHHNCEEKAYRENRVSLAFDSNISLLFAGVRGEDLFDPEHNFGSLPVLLSICWRDNGAEDCQAAFCAIHKYPEYFASLW